MDTRQWLCWQVLGMLAGTPPESLPEPPPDADAHMKLVHLAKGDTLFDVGQPHPYVHVLRQGCVKTIYRDALGEEWVQDFFCEGAFLCSLTSLTPGGTSSYACEALEPCVLERIDYAWLEATSSQHPIWQRALLHGWKDYATRREVRERDLLTLSPAARYTALMAQQPGLLARVPQKELARYLGITPVSLSRIRARLRSPSPILSS
jgi:CRP/FNR family transcriptional regulator, anaerobic regulatory protein